MKLSVFSIGCGLGIIAFTLANSPISAAERSIDNNTAAIKMESPRFYDQPVFLNDIGLVPSGTAQTYSGDCAGIESCGDYFDVIVETGESLVLSLCPDQGGSADFDTGLGIWDAANIPAGPVATNDDYCGLLSFLRFSPSVSGTYRILIGTFAATEGGTYTLSYRLAPLSLNTAGNVKVGQDLNVAGGAQIVNDLFVGNGLALGGALSGIDGELFVSGGLSVSGPYLKIPRAPGAPPAADCPPPPDYSNEGGLMYDFANNVIWVCAPDFGGWHSLTLSPPAP